MQSAQLLVDGLKAEGQGAEVPDSDKLELHVGVKAHALEQVGPSGRSPQPDTASAASRAACCVTWVCAARRCSGGV